jgi:hypothetical protein
MLPVAQSPLKRVLEGVVLAPHQTAEVDEIVFERDFVFGLEIPAIERRVIGTEAEVEPGLIQPPRYLTYRGEFCKGAGLQVRTRTEFETDTTLAHLGQQMWQMEQQF